MRTEYRALVAKVEGFTQGVEARRADDLSCRAGCASCCHAWLTVSSVEADEVREALAGLAPALRQEVQARGQRELGREARAQSSTEDGAESPRCAMLDDDGRCSVYHARPLVCRTQGHALRYPPGFVPTELVNLRLSNGEVTWCPLNYTAAAPAGADVLDAERVDQILAVVARRHGDAAARSRAEPPPASTGHTHDARTSLSALAAERDVLNDGTVRDDESDQSDQSGRAAVTVLRE